MKDYALIRVLGGIAFVLGLVFSIIILLVALPHSPYGCGLYEVFFGDYTCASMRSLILIAALLVLFGIAGLACILIAKKAWAVIASGVAAILYAIAMWLLLFHGVAGSLAGMH